MTKNEADAVKRGLKVAKLIDLIAIQFLQTINLPAEFNMTYTTKNIMELHVYQTLD